MMTYKGYIGQVEFDDKAEIFHGEVINTRDVITFQGKSVAQLKRAFHESIDDYLAFCKERNEEPDLPFSGKFNLRIDPELHKQVSILARKHQMSLNKWISEIIKIHVQEEMKGIC